MANFSAISDRLDLSTDSKTEVQFCREYLRADDIDDPVIEVLLESIKQKADSYLKNKFVDDDGNPLAIPADVKIWVLEMLGRKFNRRANGLKSESVSGVDSISWDQEDFSDIEHYRKMSWL